MTFGKYKLRYEAWTTALLLLFILMPVLPIIALSLDIFEIRTALLINMLLMLLTLPFAIAGFESIKRAIGVLETDAQKIRTLDFSPSPHPRSFIRELEDLQQHQNEMKHSLQTQTTALRDAQSKLASLVENGLLLSSERDKHRLLRHILMAGKRICNADAATLYLMTDHDTLRITLRSKADTLPSIELPLHDLVSGQPNEHHVSTYVALHNQAVLIDDVYRETRFDLSGTRRFDEDTGYRTVSMLCVPLASRSGEVLGVLQFMNALDPVSGAVVGFSAQSHSFIEALASQSAVALDNHNLIDSQTALIDAMIEILAGAIDAKSPYTGGHCARVPDLALMLAEQASAEREGPLAAFGFHTDEEWREFRIGAWLHDCGKITTPEHIVDKATKLEIIYNRIHEIRMRFEVLLRDAMIERLERIAAGEPSTQADAHYSAAAQQLRDDFAFVAQCNIGGEEMESQNIERLHVIAQRTWTRHFDNRLGLSHEESRRLEALPSPPLPTTEQLLADKPEHLLRRGENKALDPKYGFKLVVPEYQFNFGELYNLSVSRGTLTAEERFKVNEHITQTIVMLENLPFPKNLRRVPEYAGTHHETLLGTGYPRQLDAASLSIPARIMAIADIFEALTASDRPYKKAKTLSESIGILANLRDRGHIDADLFALFLREGLHLRYGARHLHPEQLDEVDVEAYLHKPN
ncbi:HD domain-containing phosphohydrolase [Pseudomonas borbori]